MDGAGTNGTIANLTPARFLLGPGKPPEHSPSLRRLRRTRTELEAVVLDLVDPLLAGGRLRG
jgi:hypothetical protein